MSRVVVFGSANADLTCRMARLPTPGQTVAGESFDVSIGGKGLNQAVAAGRLGASTAFVGRVGADGYGGLLRAGLLDAVVDASGMLQDPSLPSGLAVVWIDAVGQNEIVVVPGSNGAVGAAELRLVGAHLAATGGILLLQLELPMFAVVAAVGAARDAGALVVLDPAPAPIAGLPAALYADHVILTPNQSEAADLVGYDLTTPDAVVRAARELLARGLLAVVVKLGDRGAYWAKGDANGWQPALKVDVVDTVGAGDAVNGALAAAMADGATLPDAVRWGVAAGSVNVTRAGAALAMPTREQVQAALEQLPPTTGFSP